MALLREAKFGEKIEIGDKKNSFGIEAYRGTLSVHYFIIVEAIIGGAVSRSGF